MGRKTVSRNLSVPLGTGYDRKSAFGTNHMAYLRHAIPDYKSIFYPYFVPTGQILLKIIFSFPNTPIKKSPPLISFRKIEIHIGTINPPFRPRQISDLNPIFYVEGKSSCR